MGLMSVENDQVLVVVLEDQKKDCNKDWFREKLCQKFVVICI